MSPFLDEERKAARPATVDDVGAPRDTNEAQTRDDLTDRAEISRVSDDDASTACVLSHTLAEAIAGITQTTTASLDALRAEVDRFQQRAEAYETNARAMHARIELLQQDQIRQLLKPVFERLASLHAQAEEIAQQKLGIDNGAAGDFAHFADAIEEAMSLYDLESVGAEADIPFDARRHHAARAVPTDDPARNGRVQRVMRQGFSFVGADRVFLPARVAVHRLAVDPNASKNRVAPTPPAVAHEYGPHVAGDASPRVDDAS